MLLEQNLQSQAATAEVGNVLAQRIRTVAAKRGIYPRHQLQMVVLIGEPIAEGLELGGIGFSPPIRLVAPQVVLRAGAVKAVSQLMAYGCAEESPLQGVFIAIFHVGRQ